MSRLKVTQIGSPIGRPNYQRDTLVSLGLNKLRRSKVVANTPENRGRIARVAHLVTVEAVHMSSEGAPARGA